MSATLNRSLRDLAAAFRATLVAAQAERADRDEFVTVDGETGCGWVFYERAAMRREVNRVRADAGLPEVPIEAVRQVEQFAAGHVDYTQKFAYYCAELALDCSPIYRPTTKEARS